MRLTVHGIAYVIAPGKPLDDKKTAAVVRVVTQEWRRTEDGSFEKSADPLFIDLHTTQQRLVDRILCLNKGDDVLVEGKLMAGKEDRGRTFVYIELSDIATMAPRVKKPLQQDGIQKIALPSATVSMPAFAPVDVSALPERSIEP
jgi:hypothetical protein